MKKILLISIFDKNYQKKRKLDKVMPERISYFFITFTFLTSLELNLILQIESSCEKQQMTICNF